MDRKYDFSSGLCAQCGAPIDAARRRRHALATDCADCAALYARILRDIGIMHERRRELDRRRGLRVLDGGRA